MNTLVQVVQLLILDDPLQAEQVVEDLDLEDLRAFYARITQAQEIAERAVMARRLGLSMNEIGH